MKEKDGQKKIILKNSLIFLSSSLHQTNFFKILKKKKKLLICTKTNKMPAHNTVSGWEYVWFRMEKSPACLESAEKEKKSKAQFYPSEIKKKWLKLS